MPTRTLSDEERQARREADRQRSREAVEALRASDGWEQWLRLRHRLHSYSYSYSYSFTNQLLIAHAMPHATRVAGFRAWLKLGYCVRRGEHASIRIWQPLPPSKRQLEQWRAAGADPQDKPPTRFRMGPVFDRSQVEPLPAPAQPVALGPPIARPEGDSLRWTWQPLEMLATELGCQLICERHPDGRSGCFYVELDFVSINEANAVNHQVKTLVHELSHVRLRRSGLSDVEPLSYSRRSSWSSRWRSPSWASSGSTRAATRSPT